MATSLVNRNLSLPPRQRIAHLWLNALAQINGRWDAAALNDLVRSALSDFYWYLDGNSGAGGWDLQALFAAQPPTEAPSVQDIEHLFMSLRNAFRESLTDRDWDTTAAIMKGLDDWTRLVVSRFDQVYLDRARKQGEDIARQMAEHRLLNCCTSALNASLDLMSAFNATAKLALDLVGADLCIVYEREADVFHPRASAGKVAHACEPVSINSGHLIERIIIDEQQQDLPLERVQQNWGLPQARAVTCTPLRAANDVIGSVITVYRQPQYFTPHQIRLREVFAYHAGQAVSNAHLFERLSHQTLAQERRRIACDLHDTMLQTMITLNINLQVALSHANQGNWERVKPLLEEARWLGKTAVQEGRDVLRGLRDSGSSYEDLLDALRPELELFAERSGIVPELHTSGSIPVSQEIGHQVCRLVGEALNNIYRHARASRVVLTLETAGDELRLWIADDGIGFQPQDTTHSHSFGLIGMRERAQLINAKLTIDSMPGQGTTVALRVLLESSVPRA